MGRISDARERLTAAVSELFWTGSYDGTTVERICARAGVRKGSFYHFFPDKSALALAALEAEWHKYRPRLEGLFSAALPPLERIRRHCEFSRREQAELRRRHGCVLGCPLCTLGTEVSTRDRALQRKVKQILAHNLEYLETAIRDAHAAGEICAPDPRRKAEILHAYQLGLLTQARIQNDLAVLRNLTSGSLELLGAATSPARVGSGRTKPRRGGRSVAKQDGNCNQHCR